MAVKYSVFKQKFDVTRKGELKYNARAQVSGELKFKTLCERISDRGTVTKGDVMAVLEGCITVMKTALEDGMIVRFGDFGSFQINVSSQGTTFKEAFTNGNITGAKIIFRPGDDLTANFNNLTFEKVNAKRTRNAVN
jgi:predicted histone-like DNA-binding protein